AVGRGAEPALAPVCRDHLGVDSESLRVVHGDTAVVPDGMGAFGSRTSMLTGTAVMQASIALHERLLRLAADQLEIAPDDLVVEGDRVHAKGAPTRAITLRELAEAARPAHAPPRRIAPRLVEHP